MGLLDTLSENFRTNTTNIMQWADYNSPAILLATGIAGFTLAVFGAAKHAPKAKEELEQARKDRAEDCKKTTAIAEDTCILAKNYWKEAALVIGSTTALIFSYKELNGRLAAATALNASYLEYIQTYKKHVKEEVGERQAEKIDEVVSEDYVNRNSDDADEVVITNPGGMLIKDYHTGRYFSATKDQVLDVEKKLIKRLSSGSEYFISQNEMWDEFGLRHIGLGDDKGFTTECWPEFDMNFANIAEDGRPCCLLRYNLVSKPASWY